MAVSGAWTYTESGGNATITSYDSGVGGATPTIPTTLDTYPVIAIAANAMKSKSLTSVTINHAVTLYNNCLALNSGMAVNLNATVSVNDHSLASESAFNGCNIGNGLTIGASVTTIPLNLFNTVGLTSVSLPSTPMTLYNTCFANNSGLSVSISGSITTVDHSSLGEGAFYNCSIGNGLTLNEGVASLGVGLFRGSGLTALSMPSTLTSIGNHCFLDVFLNANIDLVLPSTPMTLGDTCFYNGDFSSVTVNSNVTCGTSSSAPFYNGSVSAITIAEGVTTIPASLFQGCTCNMSELTFPSTLTTLGTNCFFDSFVGKTASLVLPSSITTLGNSCFYNGDFSSVTVNSDVTCGTSTSAPFYNGSVSAITIAEGVTTIPADLFGHCCSGKNLNLVLPSSLTTLGNTCFDYGDFSSVTVNSNLTCGIGTSAPFYSGSIAYAKVSEGVTTIPAYLFYTSETTKVLFSSTVNNIGAFALSTNNTLTTIVFKSPSAVTFGANVLQSSQPSPKGTIYGQHSSVQTWAGGYSTYYDYSGTLPTPTVTTTSPATNITQTTADLAGNVSSDNGFAITERGFVYSTSATPTTADTKGTVTGTTGAMSKTIESLTNSTLYHFRAYAINELGTGYGADVSFITLGLSRLKRYEDGSWVAHPLKKWNGSSWVDYPLKRWNGSSWMQ